MEKFKTAIITISDRAYRKESVDKSGPMIKDFIQDYSYIVVEDLIIPDEAQLIQSELIRLCDENIPLIITTGGTGFSKRDVTPEATRAVIEKEAPGLSEAMRAYGAQFTNKSYLSRGICGIRKNSLIINLPGSPKGAIQSLEAIVDILDHGIGLM